MPFTVPTFVAVGDPGNSTEETAWTAVSSVIESANAGALQGFKNRLINGGFAINQRAAASNADDTYCLDRWYVLTQTGAVAVTQLTDPETGAPTGIRLTQSQASAQRMGLAQIVESANCRDLRSVITTLAGRVRLSTSADVRYAVLEWTGTADSVTSDVVADWTSASYTAGGFFNSTTLNVLAVGEVACAANTWRDLTALNATLGASANNIIVIVWTEGTVAQNVTLDLNRMQWEPGETATAFEVVASGAEWDRCLYYFERLGGVTGTPNFGVGLAFSTTSANVVVRFKRKRTAVTVAFSDAASTFRLLIAGSAAAVSALANTEASRDAVFVTATSSGLTAGDAVQLQRVDATAPTIDISSEL